MHVRVNVYVCLHICACMCVGMHACMHICTCVYVYICMHTNVYIHMGERRRERGREVWETGEEREGGKGRWAGASACLVSMCVSRESWSGSG